MLIKGRETRLGFLSGAGMTAFALSLIIPYLEKLPARYRDTSIAIASALAGLDHFYLAVKRLHDTGKSGKTLFYFFVPLLGGLYVEYLLFLGPGTRGENEYGPDPREERNFRSQLRGKSPRLRETARRESMNYE